jgi:hypothetical protein
MKERLAPLMKKGTSKGSKCCKLIIQTETPKEELSPEEARQQMCAGVIEDIKAKADQEELEKAMFGHVIGLTSEEEEERVEVMRLEAHRKEEENLKKQLAKEEVQRLAKIQKDREVEEARERQRCEKEREEESKKRKREIERKKLLASEAELKEERRSMVEDRIIAMRKEQAAEAEL